MYQKTITILLVLIVIGGLAWYINKNYIVKDSTGSSGFTKESITQESSLTKPALFFVTHTSSTDIWLYQDAKSKKVYTDSDESEKILKISNYADGSVLVIQNKDENASSGDLVEININNRSKTKLQSNFAVPRSLAYSSDTSKIGYVLFSNLEDNYGYSLYISSKTGENKKAVFNSSSEIKSPVWLSESNKIAFEATSEANGTIKIYDGAKDKIVEELSLEKKLIDSLHWPNVNKIIYSWRDLGSNKGGLSVLDLDTKKTDKISDYEGGYVSYLWEDKRMENFAYIVSQESAQNKFSSGQLYVYAINNNTRQSIQKASLILGWTN